MNSKVSNIENNLNSMSFPALRLTEQQTTAGETVHALRKQESVFSTSQLKHSQTSLTMTMAAMSNIRKDPCFEYFNMMLVAKKMKYQKHELVLKIDVNKLWTKAVDELKLTFVEFQEFIEREVTKQRMISKYQRHLGERRHKEQPFKVWKKKDTVIFE